MTLGLTDLDSKVVVPASSPLVGGDFALMGQADQQNIFVHNPGVAGQALTQLPVATHSGDVTWVMSTTGSLFMTDSATNTRYQITGQVTPVVIGCSNPHGLLFAG